MDREAIEKTLERILAINFREGNPNRRGSQLALFNEFLRRSALWCDALDWPQAHPIASDIPGRLEPEVRASPVNTTLLQQSLRTLGNTSVFERMLLTYVLHWSGIRGMPHVKAYNLPDIYEPVLVFYERGGWLNKELGSEQVWEISGVADRIGRAADYLDLAPLDMSPQHLNTLDG